MTTDAELIAAEGTLGSWLIQTRDQILAAIAASSLAPGSIGALPNDGTAILALKSLAIVNNAGSAILAKATGANGHGIEAEGWHGMLGTSKKPGGSGAHFEGNNPGATGAHSDGGDGISSQGYKWGSGLALHGGKNTATDGSVGGAALTMIQDAPRGFGMRAAGAGDLAGACFDGLQGILARGASGGPAVRLESGTGGSVAVSVSGLLPLSTLATASITDLLNALASRMAA